MSVSLRSISAVALAFPVAWLSACTPYDQVPLPSASHSPTPSLAATAPSESPDHAAPAVTLTSEDPPSGEPRGFHFESGFLEFGDFDPYTLGDNIFNPCTEITEAEYAAAGFPDVDVTGGMSFRGAPYCPLPSSPEELERAVVKGFLTGTTNRSLVEEAGLLLPAYRSELLPDLYAFGQKNGHDDGCYVQIDTSRGAFGATAGGLLGLVDEREMCELAVSLMEQLFISTGTVDVH